MIIDLLVNNYVPVCITTIDRLLHSSTFSNFYHHFAGVPI